jgi:hypothetical protein
MKFEKLRALSSKRIYYINGPVGYPQETMLMELSHLIETLSGFVTLVCNQESEMK